MGEEAYRHYYLLLTTDYFLLPTSYLLLTTHYLLLTGGAPPLAIGSGHGGERCDAELRGMVGSGHRSGEGHVDGARTRSICSSGLGSGFGVRVRVGVRVGVRVRVRVGARARVRVRVRVGVVGVRIRVGEL